MSRSLFPYYERELIFIRQMAQDFARQYPAAAGRLLLEPNRSGDPHVERLIESFALIAGRVHHKLDDEFPELTDGLLSVLYPHYLAPTPSMGIVQFQLDPTRAKLPKGFHIARGSRMQSPAVGTLPCIFQTSYDTTLWPFEVKSAVLQGPPFPAGLSPPRRTSAALRLELHTMAGMRMSEILCDKLRFYLNGDGQIVTQLYELIFNHATQVLVRVMDDGVKPDPLVLDPEKVISQVGFEQDEALLPYPKRSFPGYRLLTEFFSFPRKFWFFDLGGWKDVARHPDFAKKQKFEVVVFFNRQIKALEEWVDASTFCLGATPVVNLFRQTAEPIPLTQTKMEYRVTPDVAHPFGKEVYSIDSVCSINPSTGEKTDYMPFYSYQHGRDRDSQKAFWYPKRKASTHGSDFGTDVWLTLVDLNFNPSLPAASTLIVETTCTNRNLPAQLQHFGEGLQLSLTGAAPLTGTRCLRVPGAALHPPLRRGAYWGLISHLCLNHLSISDPVDGKAALQEILRLYDFSDPGSGQQQMSDVNRQLIEGVDAVASRRVVGRVAGVGGSGFCRGVEVTVTLDEQKYVGTGMYLFACMLERFLGLYASINSFSQLVLRTKQREGVVKKWLPRTADRQLL